MPRGGGRGHKGGHKGQRRHFTSPEELEASRQKEEREREWREKHGNESPVDDKEEEKNATSSEEEDGSSQDEKKPPNVIEVENPNRVMNKMKKVSQLDTGWEGKAELSRKEREEIERQKARANYQRLHAEGKTDEARADLARLAIIKKQREEAAKKREDERKAKEAAKAAKTETINKALGKGRKT